MRNYRKQNLVMLTFACFSLFVTSIDQSSASDLASTLNSDEISVSVWIIISLSLAALGFKNR